MFVVHLAGFCIFTPVIALNRVEIKHILLMLSAFSRLRAQDWSKILIQTASKDCYNAANCTGSLLPNLWSLQIPLPSPFSCKWYGVFSIMYCGTCFFYTSPMSQVSLIIEQCLMLHLPFSRSGATTPSNTICSLILSQFQAPHHFHCEMSNMMLMFIALVAPFPPTSPINKES